MKRHDHFSAGTLDSNVGDKPDIHKYRRQFHTASVLSLK
jgi:hypothetical protein